MPMYFWPISLKFGVPKRFELWKLSHFKGKSTQAASMSLFGPCPVMALDVIYDERRWWEIDGSVVAE